MHKCMEPERMIHKKTEEIKKAEEKWGVEKDERETGVHFEERVWTVC